MIGLRVPVELRRQLEERAAANHRNLSQECERALERSFSPEALFVDCVRAMEGAEGYKRIADYVRAMALEVYGVAASNAGLALMRQLSAYEVYGEHFIPFPADIDICKTAIAALNEAIRESKASSERRQQQGTPPVSAQQVRDAMVSRIANGEWKPNATIPDESELACDFGVSTETVREALDIMERERLLTRRAGEAAASRKGPIFLVAA
jgi:hypothetical protein